MNRSAPRTREDIVGRLTRLLRGGPLDHLPKRRDDLLALLALAASRIEPDADHSEAQINASLQRWLETFALPAGVDHVTVRRCLVDHGFLQRDHAGSIYRACPARIETELTTDARSVDPGSLLATLVREREAKRRAHAERS